jgi:alkanesulfonate monooxygenase SsuD/methylene tetrahydromethanopterin reductase-like flavin-dependent oxidoreductase (luciferase family)
MGCLTLSFGNIGNSAQRFNEYRRRIKNCDPVGSFVNEKIIAANWLFCHEDKEYALKRGRQMVSGFGSAAAQVSEIKGVYPASNYLEAGLLGMFRADPDNASAAGKMPDGLCLGDPAEIIKVLKRWEETGVDRLVFLINYMEILTQEEVLNSLRLFAQEVMPHFDKDFIQLEISETAIA